MGVDDRVTVVSALCFSPLSYGFLLAHLLICSSHRALPLLETSARRASCILSKHYVVVYKTARWFEPRRSGRVTTRLGGAGKGQPCTQPARHLEEACVAFRIEEAVPEEEVDQAHAAVWLELAVDHAPDDLVHAHQLEPGHLAVVGAGHDVGREVEVVDVLHLGLNPARGGAIVVRDDRDELDEGPDERLGQGRLLGALAHDRLAREVAGGDAAGDRVVEVIGPGLLGCGPAGDPQLDRAGAIFGVGCVRQKETGK